MANWQTMYNGGSNPTYISKKNKLYKFISEYPYAAISIILLFSFIIFLILGLYTSFQEKLPSIAIEIFGALITVLIIEYLIVKITSKSDYHQTKYFYYHRLNMAVTGIIQVSFQNNLGIINSSELINEGLLREKITPYIKDDMRLSIENKFINLSDEEATLWIIRNNDYLYYINNFIKITPLIKPKDTFFVNILYLEEIINKINILLKDQKLVRIANCKFFSVQVIHLARFCLIYLDSGLYNKYYLPTDLKQTIDLTQ